MATNNTQQHLPLIPELENENDFFVYVQMNRRRLEEYLGWLDSRLAPQDRPAFAQERKSVVDAGQGYADMAHSYSQQTAPQANAQQPQAVPQAQPQQTTPVSNAQQPQTAPVGNTATPTPNDVTALNMGAMAPQWEDWKFIPDYFTTYNRPEITLDDTKQALAQLANAMGGKGASFRLIEHFAGKKNAGLSQVDPTKYSAIYEAAKYLIDHPTASYRWSRGENTEIQF